MEAALQSYLASHAKEQSAGARGAGTQSVASSSREKAERAEAGFNRTMVRASGVSGTLGSTDADPGQLKALETMQRNHRIAERLARVKAAAGEAGKNS
jgi:hypothetical protein